MYIKCRSCSVVSRVSQPSSCSTSSSCWHADLGDLVAGTDDLLALLIFDIVDIFVLPLSTLPDFNLAATSNNTDTHGTEQVVRGVAVHVHASVEHGGSVLANARADHCLSTRVMFDEFGNVVDYTSHGDQTAPVLGLVDIVVPFHYWQLIKWYTPVELGTLLVEFLLLLLEPSFVDFILLELLQVIGQAELLPDPDGPLGGVVLMPLNGVAVVRWELVMEVVVSLAEGDNSSDDMVSWGVTVVKWLVAKPMGKRIDAESCLLNDEDAEDTSIDESTKPVTPKKTSHQHGKG